MTKLIVTPIDMTAPGSYRERKRVLALMRRVRSATTGAELADVFDEAEAMLHEYAETDSGEDIDTVLAECSAREFDQLFNAILIGETVPNPSSAS